MDLIGNKSHPNGNPKLKAANLVNPCCDENRKRFDTLDTVIPYPIFLDFCKGLRGTPATRMAAIRVAASL